MLVDYLCTVIGGRLWPQSDAADARWATRSELAAFEMSGVTLSVIDKAYAAASGSS